VLSVVRFSTSITRTDASSLRTYSLSARLHYRALLEPDKDPALSAGNERQPGSRWGSQGGPPGLLAYNPQKRSSEPEGHSEMHTDDRCESSGKSLINGVAMPRASSLSGIGAGTRDDCGEQETHLGSWHSSAMSSLTLPGEIVTVAHPNLKLGPGLAQDSLSSSSRDSVLVTRAGSLNHSANGAKWWVEGNSRRVRL
jgi:hypothetical protein